MDALEIATEFTLALIEKTPKDDMIGDKTDKQSAAKWIGETFETILIGVVDGIRESNKPRQR